MLSRDWYKNYWLWGAVLVLLLSATLFFFKLGEKAFWDYDEGTYANVIHDTLKSNDLMTLKIGQNAWFEKPPLYFWLAMAASKASGPEEFSYRVPAAVSGVLVVLLVMLIVFELSASAPAAVAAGLMLATTGAFVEAGREVRLDVPVIAMILLAVFAFLKGRKDQRWLLLIGVALAVGFLLKSVIAGLAVIFILVWSVVNKDISWLRSKWLWVGAGLGVLIVAPWHWYETKVYGKDFWDIYLIHHVIKRFETDVIGGSTTLQNYINFFFTYSTPWTVAFGVLVVWLVAKFKKIRASEYSPIFVMALTALCIFLVFALSSTKILYYLLPVYPFAVCALALMVPQIIKNKKALQVLLGVTPVLVLLAGWVTINYSFHLFEINRDNDLIVKDERTVGLLLAKTPVDMDVYTYEHDYWDTLRFYSGKQTIHAMADDQVLTKPFYLVMQSPLADTNPFPAELSSHLTKVFRGEVLTLYEFRP